VRLSVASLALAALGCVEPTHAPIANLGETSCEEALPYASDEGAESVPVQVTFHDDVGEPLFVAASHLCMMLDGMRLVTSDVSREPPVVRTVTLLPGSHVLAVHLRSHDPKGLKYVAKSSHLFRVTATGKMGVDVRYNEKHADRLADRPQVSWHDELPEVHE
jgi:hypothetical protein